MTDIYKVRKIHRVITDHRDLALLDTCHRKSIQLLRANSARGGVLAATAGPKAVKRGYTAIFGRDAAVCAIGMALSGNAVLKRGASAGLHTLASHQAPNGQIPKFVDLTRREADFWYLGCIDATLWWIIARALLDKLKCPGGLRRQYAAKITVFEFREFLFFRGRRRYLRQRLGRAHGTV